MLMSVKQTLKEIASDKLDEVEKSGNIKDNLGDLRFWKLCG